MAVDPVVGDLGTDNDVYDVDTHAQPTKPAEGPQPLYRIYADSKIAISKHVGKYWKNKQSAALKAYEDIRLAWDQLFMYYNFHHMKTITTPRGQFKRGDCSENVLFSNLNIMLPAVYSRDPDITCSTVDKQDEPFCDTIEALINQILKRPNLMNAKPKIKKAIGLALLTNFGILKFDWTKKDDSLEMAAAEMQRITNLLKDAADQEEVADLYGQLEALEENMEIYKPSGPRLSGVLPHNLLVDPYAEQSDALDSEWMMERIFYPTAGLKARFTIKDPEGEEGKNAPRVLVYNPTHKAVFSDGVQDGSRDDGLGLVLRAMDGAGDVPQQFEAEGRAAYVNMYFTECWLVWDKKTRRVMLFHRDDWAWPIWVWDDPLRISRFYPYFVIGFNLQTGGTVGVGETAYYLDQQDEINDINRQVAKMRRSIYDFFFYNSDKVDQQEAEKFIDAVRGNGSPNSRKIIGVRAGEDKDAQDLSKIIQAFVPPQLQFEQMFNKQGVIETINRISNTSDALRGVQFKTNTNVASVTSYQESMKLSVGSKVDVVEDTVADLANAIAESAIQNYSQEDVAGLVGTQLAEGWKSMDVAAFNSTYSLELVAGSMEKPNSVFKKKEAIDIVTAVGQFARAAPGAALRIMLRVLQQAFTEIVIKKEDWDALDQEVQANLQKGVSTPGQAGTPGQPPGQPPGGAQPRGDAQALIDKAKQLPPQDQQEIMGMSQRGEPPQRILAFIQQKTGASSNATGPEPVGQQRAQR